MERAHRSGTKATVLVVFAAPTDRRLVVESLERAGHEAVPTSSMTEALFRLSRSTFDAVVCSLELDDASGLDLLRGLPGVHAWIPVVVVTRQPSLDTAVEALRLHAADYRTAPAGDISEHVERAVRDFPSPARVRLDHLRRVLTEALRGLDELDAPPADDELRELTAREHEVLEQLLSGLTAAQVGEVLHISSHTVRNHMKSIFRKLGISSQVELLVRFSGRSRGT